jgi:transcriptional regulator GlxA family with amidase domain
LLNTDSKEDSFRTRTGCLLKEISAETGFCDEYHMSRFFKKLAGILPGGYKRRVRTNYLVN